MVQKLTPTLAVILAGGLAAGIGLARPGQSPDPVPAESLAADNAQAAPESAETDGYREGNRSGNRGGVPASGQPADSGGSGPADEVAAITIEGFAFLGPATVTPGTALSVANLDGAAHTLTFRSGEVDTGSIDGGGSATVNAPTAPGTYQFFCAIHPSMSGQITVA